MSSTETPEQRAARIERVQAQAKDAKETRALRARVGGELMRKHRLSIAHCPREEHPSGKSIGGVTVVFRRVGEGNHLKSDHVMYEAAAAFQHKNDQYVNTEGRFWAASRFEMKRHALFRVPKSENPGRWLSFVFAGTIV